VSATNQLLNYLLIPRKAVSSVLKHRVVF